MASNILFVFPPPKPRPTGVLVGGAHEIRTI
jgi:hypothetical protein